MSRRDTATEQNRDHDSSGHIPWRIPWRGVAGLAVGLTLGMLVVEHLFFRYLLTGVTWSLPGTTVHGALDFLVLTPLVLAVLVASLALARRHSREPGSWSGVLSTVGLASLSLVLVSLATVAPRDALHEELGTRFDLPLVQAVQSAEEDLGDAEAADEAVVLCSYDTLRRRDAGEALSSRTESALGAWLEKTVERTLIAQMVFLPGLLLGFGLIFRRELSRSSRRFLGRASTRRVLRWGFAGAALAMLAFALVHGQSFAQLSNVSAAMAFDACNDGGAVRTYDVSAIEIEMTLNRFGDHDPGAFMYVLDQSIQAVRDQEATNQVSGGLRKDPIQPLVIRAALGECVVINFTNQLPDEAGMTFLGLPFLTDHVGLNGGALAAPGQTVMYTISIPTDPLAERAYYFYDPGASRERVSHGLFGALVAEPAGSSWLDPETGQLLDNTVGSNWEAIIVDPNGPDFRESVLIYHEVGDESFTNIQSGGGGKLPQLDNASAIYRPGARAINYRSEPFLNRMDLKQDKSLGYSSYTFGDPATPIPRSYLGDPSKTRLVHGGSELFHVHHLHGGADRWRRNPEADASNDISSGLDKEPAQNAFSTHLDSQSIGPGTSYNLEHECGAGGCQQAAGDFLYHCHIGQHYIAGMWSLWRVHDTIQPDVAQIPEEAAPPGPVSAWELLFSNSGRTYDGHELVQTITNPSTQMLLTDWVASQLPPQGVGIDDQDAAVWDWVFSTEGGDPAKPTVLGEPDDTTTWANFDSPIPGQRPEVLFNPDNGRYTWPLFRPHLGQRPPFAPNGHSGAPWLGEDGDSVRPDGLCPDSSLLLNPEPTRRTRVYPVTAINVPIQVTDGGTDNNGKIFVLGDEKDDVLAGVKPRQPLAIRSNVQDCVDVILTNEIPDSADSNSFSKVNMHTHFVQFDPQASDGVITGFSYEQSVRPYATENRSLASAISAGATVLPVTNTSRLHVGAWVGVGLGEGMCTNPGGGADIACTEVRKITALDTVNDTITLDQPLALDHASGEAVGVEFVRHKWYSDVDTGTVFWHDHVDFFNWDHGLFGAHIIEPAGSTYHDPVTGQEVRSGTIVDIHAPSTASVGAGQQGPFRELTVFLHNNNPVTGGINEGGTINLRAEPFASRTGSAALRFSSVMHDDPRTPLPRAYLGDPFVIRGLGLVERVGGLRVTGHRFQVERWAGVAPPTDTTHLGISERFDLILEGGAGGPLGLPGDFLYYSTIGRDFEAGAWGVLRVHDTLQADLQPLPGLDPPTGSGFPDLTFTGSAPPAATGAGNPCPGGSPVRAYTVRLSPTTIIYQDAPLIRDTGAFAYTLDGGADPAEVREPLVIRANEGDCLEVTLVNATSVPAAFHVGELLFDPQGSHGLPIGFNRDSSVPAGGNRLYRFYADTDDVGLALVSNLANTTSLSRGAFAGVVVEPVGSAWTDPATGQAIDSGVVAEITDADGSFREMVVLATDEDTQIGQNIMPYPTAIAGLGGWSYSVGNLSDRDSGSNPGQVFDSAIHGDPRLVLEAEVFTPVILRVGMPWGDQEHVFSVEGHRFPLDVGLTGAEQVSSRLLMPGMSYDADLVGGAGGEIGILGDYLVSDHRDPFTERGDWGLLRVTDVVEPAVCGNDVIEGTEECDGTDLGGATCADQGCSSGTVSCTASCTLDFSACTSCGPVCGNGICEVGEDCTTCSDCDGVTNGNPANRFCCGNGVQEGPEGDGTICDGNF